MKIIVADVDEEKVQDGFNKIAPAIRQLDLNVFELFELCTGLLSDAIVNLPPLRRNIMERVDWHCQQRIKRAGVQ